jgi:hypothetical protein
LRTFALICVAVSSGYVMYMGWWLINLLSANDWCVRALGAGKASGKSDGRELIKGAEACIDLMSQQISALSINSYIFAASTALCLLALMVIVIAGGRISFKGGKDGISGEIGKELPAREILRDGDVVEVTKKELPLELGKKDEAPDDQPPENWQQEN